MLGCIIIIWSNYTKKHGGITMNLDIRLKEILGQIKSCNEEMAKIRGQIKQLDQKGQAIENEKIKLLGQKEIIEEILRPIPGDGKSGKTDISKIKPVIQKPLPEKIKVSETKEISENNRLVNKGENNEKN